jgi:hypothetical protein
LTDLIFGIVDQLDGDELIVGEFEHGQVALPGLGDAADNLVADARVEGERPLGIAHAKAEMQGPHGGSFSELSRDR